MSNNVMSSFLQVLISAEGISKGCAFVTFSKRVSAHNAIRHMHQSTTMEVYGLTSESSQSKFTFYHCVLGLLCSYCGKNC